MPWGKPAPIPMPGLNGPNGPKGPGENGTLGGAKNGPGKVRGGPNGKGS